MNELWKDIKEYEGYYQISNYGRVRSLDRSVKKHDGLKIVKGKIKSFTISSGYYSVDLCKEGLKKSFKIHSLNWDHFGDRPRDGRKLQVDHIDGNKLNNRIDNLQLLSARDNVSKYYKKHKNNINLPTGVYFYENKYYVAKISINNKLIHIGLYYNIRDASRAYQN